MDKSSHGRKDRLIKERRHDTYEEKGKWPEPTLCTKCGAVFAGGRWSWKKTDGEAHRGMCPACRRTVEHCPAGYVDIQGPFFADHRDEIINIVHNVETQEKERHPLERIMRVEEEGARALVTTTGIHIARRIGDALSRSCKGELDVQYPESEKSIRVYWKR